MPPAGRYAAVAEALRSVSPPARATERPCSRASGAGANPPARSRSTVTQPTLIVWGARPVIPLAAGERFHAAIRGSELVVFDDLGHVPQ